ncbi:MAG: sugar phosphate nucleotidyltransferase [Candidatus Moranbacteria bacterium]|nr:sugar phosphate nucleotidyltransferase [bacterium]MDP1833376.1 sugar phosphate nucleotidyltransferase [Candidatus Moranbacteria bacterium]
MFLTTNTKLIAIAIALSGVVFMMFATPFLVADSDAFRESAIRSLFGSMELFMAIFLLNEFYRVKILIRKEEISKDKIKKIGSDIGKHFKKSAIGMKGIILSGGTATRLFPLTATTSKQLLPVYDRQMIFYPLNTLIKAGIRDILLIVSPENSGQYLNLLGSIFKNYGINLYFEVQKVPGGLPEAFIFGEGFIGSDNVTLILGDNIFEDDISEIISGFQSGHHIFAKKVPDPERFGVVKFDGNGKAEKIVEKPKEWISDYAISGLYIYDNEVVEVSKNLKVSERGELEITDLHRHYLEKDKLKVNILEGVWLDAGTHDSLLAASQIVKERNISQNFHPIINEAIAEFNREFKMRTQAVLNMHNLRLREEFMLHKKP